MYTLVQYGGELELWENWDLGLWDWPKRDFSREKSSRYKKKVKILASKPIMKCKTNK